MLTESYRLLRATLFTGVLALGVAPTVAHSQAQPEEPEAPADATADDTEQPDEAAPADGADASGDDADASAEQPPAPPAPPPAPPAPPPAPSAPPPAPSPAPAPQPETAPDAPAEAPAPPTPDPSQTEVDDSGSEITAEDEVIVITGSAIRRRVVTTPAPVAVLDKAELDASGLASIGDILQNLPSQGNAINVQFNNGGTGATRISLRGIGSNRTLVLVNGRRHVPGGLGANSSVDLNAIPTAIIERVEVLKDGASAVYGSDAMGGVVNIITRTEFDGAEASGYVGTANGGATTYDLSAVTGFKGERGSIVFAAGYYNQSDLFADQRDFSNQDKDFDFEINDDQTLGSTSVPQGVIIDWTGAAGNAAWDAVVAQCPTGVCYNDPEDGWRDFNFNGNSDIGEGDYYNYQPINYLVTPQERYNLFSTGNYELTDSTKFFFESSYTNRKSDQLLAPEPLFTISEGITVSAQNAYNPFGRDFTDIRRRFVETAGRRFLQDVDTFRTVLGVDGRTPKELGPLANWRWNVSFNYGRTEATEVKEGSLFLSRLARALGPSWSEVQADGQVLQHCGTGPDDPTYIDNPDCVPLNLFGGAGTITQDMLDYITYTGTSKGFSEQQSILANASGKLLDTPWGGDVRLALGTEYRAEDGAFLPDPLTASGDTTGNKGEATAGNFDVREGYAELSAVPVVRRPGAEWLEINAALRAFDYSTFGSDFTWKLGSLWRPHKAVAVRGTVSTAFRAPAIGELFSGTADSFPSVRDPCGNPADRMSDPVLNRNCNADGIPEDFTDSRSQLRSRVGGNPELQPETANIFTTGLVVEPPMVPGLAVTFDYFNITIDDSIQARGASTILNQCYRREERDMTACNQVIRGDSNLISDILDTATNVGGLETAGVDVNIRYDHQTPYGRFRHNLEGTWLQKIDSIEPDGTIIHGKGIYDLGARPAWKWNYSTLWGRKSLGAGLNVRYIGAFRECADNVCPSQHVTPEAQNGEEDVPPENQDLDRGIDPNLTGDLWFTYALKSRVGLSRLTVGVNNVLDSDPAVIYNGFLATSDASTYDFLGRFFYARFAQSF